MLCCFGFPIFICIFNFVCYRWQESGHLGLHGDLVAGHVMEGHDRACVVAPIIYNSAPVPLARVHGLEPRDVIPILVQVRMIEYNENAFMFRYEMF